MVRLTVLNALRVPGLLTPPLNASPVLRDVSPPSPVPPVALHVPSVTLEISVHKPVWMNAIFVNLDQSHHFLVPLIVICAHLAQLKTVLDKLNVQIVQLVVWLLGAETLNAQDVLLVHTLKWQAQPVFYVQLVLSQPLMDQPFAHSVLQEPQLQLQDRLPAM